MSGDGFWAMGGEREAINAICRHLFHLQKFAAEGAVSSRCENEGQSNCCIFMVRLVPQKRASTQAIATKVN